MLRKSFLSLLAAGLGVLFWSASSFAQTPPVDDTPTLAPIVAEVQQVVPLTLTVVIPSPTGPITLEVPVFLTLDIRIGVGSDLTATVAATPSVSITGTAIAPVEPEDAGEEADAAAETEATPTTEAVTTPEATPTPTPVVVVPTATPVLPTPTPAPVVVLPTPTPVPPPVVPAACPDPRSVISSPGVNQVIAGPAVTILGTAIHEQFQYFKLEIAPGANAENGFAFLSETRTPVSGGVLGSLDSTVYANGAYTLRLTVVDISGNFPPPCDVTVIVQN